MTYTEVIKKVHEFNISSENYVLLLHSSNRTERAILCKKFNSKGEALDGTYHTFNNAVVQTALITIEVIDDPKYFESLIDGIINTYVNI
jgi:hypothetical protein